LDGIKHKVKLNLAGCAGEGRRAKGARKQIPMVWLLTVLAVVLAVMWQLQFRS
jgi:hypothetical protein